MSDGYIVGPTDKDYASSAEYAYQKAVKAVCEAHPDKYRWVPDVVPFTCPSPLECVYGQCEFTETGCDAASVYPYFDCERKDVQCDLTTRNSRGEVSTCQMCVYNIHNHNADTPKIKAGDCSGADCNTCGPGDYKFYSFTDPKADAERNKGLENSWCKSKYNPPAFTSPYLNGGNKVACKTNDDCNKYASTLACMLYPDADAYGYCVDGGVDQRYLEYRRNYVNLNGETRDMCVVTQPQFRQWCEMPWQRPYKSENDINIPLADRIEAHPQTRMHPPFFYDTYSGKCYMTKDYCKKKVDEGGFDSSFGVSKEYLEGVFETCKYPKGHDAQIREGYDCCTPIGQSMAEFITGKTLFTQIDDIVNGNISFEDFMLENTQIATNIVATISDARLKENVHVMQSDFLQGIPLYMYTWSPVAHQLYPAFTHGSTAPRLGFLAADVQARFPSSVQMDEHGYCVITIDRALYQQDADYRRLMRAIYLLDTAAASMSSRQ